jgi:hypothetical protein
LPLHLTLSPTMFGNNKPATCFVYKEGEPINWGRHGGPKFWH